MGRWGAFVARRRWVVLVSGLLVVVVAAGYGFGVFSSLTDGGFDDKASESSQAADAEEAAFGRSDADVVAIYSSPDLTVDDPAFRSAVTETVDGLPAEEVQTTASYWSTRSDTFVSQDRHSTYVTVTLAGGDQDALADNYEAVKDELAAPGLETQLGGQWAVFGDVNEQVSADIARAEGISMPLVLLISLVIFGSLVAATLPVLVGGIAIIGAFALVRLLTLVTDVSVFSINIITLLGLGLAIDYALFIVSRFREELDRTDGDRAGIDTAIVRTMQTAGRTVLFSGLIVGVSLGSLLIFPQGFLKSMGFGGMAAVVVAMTAAVTILPALLAVLGPRVDRFRIRRRRRTPEGHGAWARIAHSVMRRPVGYAVVITGVLVAIGLPFLSVSWNSVDYRVLPEDAPSRVATEALEANFATGSQAEARIVVTGGSPSDVDAYVQELSDVDGVEAVRTLDQTSSDGAPVTLLEAIWQGNAQDEESRAIAEELRSVPEPPGAEVLVGGDSAVTVDLLNSLGDRLLWMGLIVVAVMFSLLFLAFGSLVLPFKAVLMNAISITASFGVVTWIFADGHLSGLLGFTPTGALEATQPILMLAILFGLSMDYEVFLLSRIREEWDRTHDNATATAIGLQRSGGIITSAALLLMIVIGGFATSGIVFIKMIGVGMLVAIFVDATVIRALLVPATMRLLGRANWWAPGPMLRWWERHGFRESPAAPAPARDLASVR